MRASCQRQTHDPWKQAVQRRATSPFEEDQYENELAIALANIAAGYRRSRFP